MSYRKHGRKYAVGYRDGNGKVVWETYDTELEAINRNAEIEYLKKIGHAVFPPSTGRGLPLSITVTDLLARYSAQADWGANAAGNNAAIIANYIAPNIGSLEVRRLTPDILAKYLDDLKSQPAVIRPGHSDTGATVGDSTIAKIKSLLHSALQVAVREKVIPVNPLDELSLPKRKTIAMQPAKDVWTDGQVATALASNLDIASETLITLGTAQAMRIGEICGLTWDRVTIYPQPVKRPTGSIYGEILIDRQIQRVNVADLGRVKAKDDIIFAFPRETPSQKTVVVLMRPKDESTRTVYFSEMTYNLLLLLDKLQKGREMLGNGDYCGYAFVLSQDSGHPYERRLLERKFQKAITYANKQGANLPTVVPHSLRHTGASVILRVSGGNVKATQAITGHASAEVLLDTYATSFAEDRMDAAIAADAALSGSQSQNNTN